MEKQGDGFSDSLIFLVTIILLLLVCLTIFKCPTILVIASLRSA